jgi:transcriptional regulator with XRE-family HTH domain
MLGTMTTRDRRADRGKREAEHLLRDIGEELREARLIADVSQSALGTAIGVSHAEVSRVERGVAVNVPLVRLSMLAAATGQRLVVKLYLAGRPLRDAGQLALLDRFRGTLHQELRWRTEVPLPIQGDLRAWDAAVVGPGWTLYLDAETRIRDVQALTRRTATKRRDTGTDRVVLLVAGTRHNRAILAGLGSPLIDDGIPGALILERLAKGQDPGGSGVVVL